MTYTGPRSYATAECPFCHRRISISKVGQMRGHRPLKSRNSTTCPGSWRKVGETA